MHITDTLSTPEIADSEGFHNVIVNIFDVALVDDPVPLLHAIHQLKLNIFLRFDAYVASQLHTPLAVVIICILPSP